MPGVAPGAAIMAREDGAEIDPAGEMGRALEEAINQVGGHDPGVTVTGEAVSGHAAQVLLDAATASNLLVVGSRGHGGFVGALIGSVSHHVVSDARCPVVVVPEPARTSDES